MFILYMSWFGLVCFYTVLYVFYILFWLDVVGWFISLDMVIVIVGPFIDEDRWTSVSEPYTFIISVCDL